MRTVRFVMMMAVAVASLALEPAGAGASNWSGASGVTFCSGGQVNITDTNPLTYEITSSVSSEMGGAVVYVANNVINPTPVDTASASSNSNAKIFEADYTGTICGVAWDGALAGYAYCIHLAAPSARCDEHYVLFDGPDLTTTSARRYIACHELGHVIGLMHPGPANPGSCIADSAYSTYSAHDLGHFGELTQRLWSGDVMKAGALLVSTNQTYSAWMQTDGNFVVYGGGSAIYATGTQGAGNFASMQTDGNFVVYNSSGVALCSTRTWSSPGAQLFLQPDGNLVVYSTGGTPLRSTYGGGFCT